jgi:DNA polymerase-1
MIKFNPNNTLFLVDGSSYLFRAFHAMPNLTTSTGEPTGAIYGVINMLKRLLNEYQPKYLAVVFDAKGKTFRDDLYPEYKANRKETPDDLSKQVPVLFEIIKAMGLPLIIEKGVEADDVIGTLTLQAQVKKIQTVIFTGDKDFAQLVNEQVFLIDTMKDSFLDELKVKEKFGVPPNLIIDYLTLMGDAIDNVKGVEKVGPKTAVKWLQQYGSLEEITKNAHQITGKIGENLRAALEYLPLSKNLVTIRCHLPLNYEIKNLVCHEINTQALIEFYQRLEFKHWLSELKPQQTVSQIALQYQIITEQAEFDRFVEILKNAPLFAVDTETTGLDYLNAELVGLSFAIPEQITAYIPLGHDYIGVSKQLEKKIILEALKPILENDRQLKIGQHIKFDSHILKNYGINIQGIKYDTMLESYVLDSIATRHDLDSLALKYLGHQNITFQDIAGKGTKQISFNQIDIETAGKYAAEDADITLKLHQHLFPLLEKEKELKTVFEEIEMPLVPVLTEIERHGVCIDAQQLHKQSLEIAQKLQILENNTWELAGQSFNLSSPKQLQEVLFEKLQLPVISKTPKGQPSTAEDVLQELALEHELPRLILEHRSLSKLKSTYTDKLPEQINIKTGRIHTSYHQANTATGRLSSSDPNLQNIPIRTEEGRRIRQAFIAPKDYVLMAADYSQIELRIMAHLSGEENLLHAFATNQDVHKITAAEVFNVSIEEITLEQRRAAKAINFGLIYGMSAFGLAKQLGISRHLAQNYVDQYFARYPNVKKYMEQTRQLAFEQGFVETILGRRLYVPEIRASNGQRRQAAERTAINAPMQGTAADIIKKAMISVHRWIMESNLEIKMIMQVHDELVFEVKENIIETARENIRPLMENAVKLKVPLLVEIGVGKNWDAAH